MESRRARMELDEAKRYIPHRAPFLFIDAIEDIVVGESAVGVRRVDPGEDYFRGHFPGRPIMPGVLVIEALAQTAAVLVGYSEDVPGDRAEIYFMSVERARFRKPVAPGDELRLRVSKINSRRRVWRFEGLAEVDGAPVAECRFTAMFNIAGESREA